MKRCAFVGTSKDNILFHDRTQGRLQNCTLSANLCSSLTVANHAYYDNRNCIPNRSMPVYVDELSRDRPPWQPSLGLRRTEDDSFPPLAAAPDVFAGANDTALVAIQQVRCCRFCLLGLCSAHRVCVCARTWAVTCSVTGHFPDSPATTGLSRATIGMQSCERHMHWTLLSLATPLSMP